MSAEHPGTFARAPLVADGRRDLRKAVGLGAPVSMAITFHPCEAETLAEAVRGELAGYGRRSTDGHCWDDHLRELRGMLADVDVRPAKRQFEVIWPTALAYGVVHRALQLAVDRVHAISASGGSPAAIAPALAAAAAALRTALAFEAVDGGGRQDVSL